ncbi:NAD-dependent epimerase/dehydratase family protein [Microbacterium sp. AZCO]|uniref:NAD-dependent epimerase/dehydratase family protein n=1 Tax=Microbacterium sp. AZCO TaxID=3142976 RepID=UPI0031F447D1
MKVVVVGGTGNISTSIVRLLLEHGHEVTCVNRGTTAVPEEVETIIVDRHDTERFESAVQAGRFDAAIDMIAFTPDDVRSSIRAFRDVGHVIHTSTVTVLGERFDWLPVTEDHPVRPTVPYAARKAEAERVYLAAHYGSGFPVTILRPSTTYGPKRALRQIGIDSTWVSRIRAGKPIIKVGDGGATHHLLHVDDAALAFVGALGKEHTVGQTYHLVHPVHTTWQDFHAAQMRAVGRDVEQVGVPADVLEAIDPQRFLFATNVFAHNMLFSAEKIQRDIPEFVPRVPVEQGLAETVEYIDSHGLGVETDDLEDRIIAAQRAAAGSVLGG